MRVKENGGPASTAQDGDLVRPLLIVDDDERFCERLGRAMERRGFQVTLATSVAQGEEFARSLRPTYAVVDLRLQDGSGLEVVQALREVREDARIIVLTGYGNIATAVAAVKVGRDRLSAEARRRGSG